MKDTANKLAVPPTGSPGRQFFALITQFGTSRAVFASGESPAFPSSIDIQIRQDNIQMKQETLPEEVNMFKRIILSLTFAAALGGAGLCLTDNAQAWVGYYRPRVVYAPRVFYGPRVAYAAPYRAYYGGYYAAPAYYYPYYAAPGYYYGGGPRVSVRIGF